MDRLEKAKRRTAGGDDYWLARDIHGLLGYPAWDTFVPVIERAMAVLGANGIEPANHIARTRQARRARISSSAARPAT